MNIGTSKNIFLIIFLGNFLVVLSKCQKQKHVIIITLITPLLTVEKKSTSKVIKLILNLYLDK